MNPCDIFDIQAGQLLGVLVLQALTLAGVSLTTYNQRRAREAADRMAHRQTHLQTTVDNLGPSAPTNHKE